MIPKYSEYDASIDRVENRTIRAILKYRNHPSILAIREPKKAQIKFCFKEVSMEEIQKEILNLNSKNLKNPIFLLKPLRKTLIYLKKFYVLLSTIR